MKKTAYVIIFDNGECYEDNEETNWCIFTNPQKAKEHCDLLNEQFKRDCERWAYLEGLCMDMYRNDQYPQFENTYGKEYHELSHKYPGLVLLDIPVIDNAGFYVSGPIEFIE